MGLNIACKIKKIEKKLPWIYRVEVGMESVEEMAVYKVPLCTAIKEGER